MSLGDVTLTTVGLASWQWDPEPVREHLADRWRTEVIDRWLATAEPEQVLPAMHRAESWFAARLLLPATLTRMLGCAVEPASVPSWPIPYPWAAAQWIDQLRNLSNLLIDGRAGIVELMLDEWEQWPADEEQALRAEIAGQLDKVPVDGINLADCFLKDLVRVVDDAAGKVDYRQDQLEEQLAALLGERDGILGAIESLLGKWPKGSPAAWASVLFRPWRWPGLARDYWTLHNLAEELVKIVTHQAAIEHEQVVTAAVANLYRQYEAAIRHTIDHIQEAADMLDTARVDARPQNGAPLGVEHLVAYENLELEATEAAAALGGLGRLALAFDEELVDRLCALSRERFGFIVEWPAVSALERLTGGKAQAVDWWAAQWAEATPLWLYDDAGQPEEARGADGAWAAVCAAEVERLQTLLDLPDRSDWRWLPAVDKQHIYLLRWRTSIAL